MAGAGSVRHRVVPIISSLEARDEAGYMHQPEAEGLPAEERAHSRTLWAMSGGSSGPASIIGTERWHFTSRGGSLRAAVFGINDGLVSNFSLVMGFAGAEAKPEYVLLAGVAGLLAGSFSMAAGNMSRCGRNASCSSSRSPWSNKSWRCLPKKRKRNSL